MGLGFGRGLPIERDFEWVFGDRNLSMMVPVCGVVAIPAASAGGEIVLGGEAGEERTTHAICLMIKCPARFVQWAEWLRVALGSCGQSQLLVAKPARPYLL